MPPAHTALNRLTRRELLRDGALVASGSLVAPLAFAALQDEPHAPASVSAHQAWTIANELIQRVVAFDPHSGFATYRLADLSNGSEFTETSAIKMAQEFSFQCDGQEFSATGTAFRLVDSHQSTLPFGKSLGVRLAHSQLALEVSAVYSVYDGHAAIRKHLVFHNTGTTPLTLTHLVIESIAVGLGSADETTLLTQYGAIPRETFYTGRSEDACLLVANGRTGYGIAVMNEVPGYMKRTEIGGWDSTSHTRIGVMYDTDLMPFERALAPGEEFSTASSSLILYRSGDGVADPQWRIPAYSAQVLERRVDAAGPPWIYNTWEPFQRGINHDTALELITAASAMGMDIFTIDDGWQLEHSENVVDTNSFPGGLDPILAAIESRSLRLGLWIPLAAVGTSSKVYRNHPEWAALDQHGQPKITGTAAGPKAVMCMASDFRRFAAARVIDAIERFRLAYVKLDLTTIFNAYGEAPGCWAHGHQHASWAESLVRIYEGISYVTSAVYARHPDVLLDLTFELWGQKHIIDAGLLAAGDLDWMSNVDDSEPGAAGPIQARQLLYQRAISMPAESMLIGNLHADMHTIAERFATAIGSAPVLLGDLRKLSAADRQWFHEKTAWFKQLRKTHKISDSFFPLGSWRQTTPSAWDGFARLARSGNGVVCLFRNKSNVPSASVHLPLLPAGRYSLRSILSDKSVGAFSQADFARGVSVAFSADSTVDILELTHLA